ncbi:MAG: phage tail assembly protein [Polaromonas sp.]
MSDTIIKPLPKPWKVGGQEATDIEIREPTVKDLVDAEKDANPALGPNAFNVALACRTVVRAGTFTGPFVASHFNGVGARSWYVMREAMQEAEALGEA